VLFPALGTDGTNLVGAGLDLAVGAFALLALAPRYGQASAAKAPSAEAARASAWTPAVAAPLLAYAAVGFTSLTYEVAWTRALALVLGSSVYAFATMLAAFLVGIALGSMGARRAADRLAQPLLVFAGGIALLGALSLGTVLLIPVLPDLFLALSAWLGLGAGAVITATTGLALLVMLPPTLVLGALFPVLCRVLADRESGPGGAAGDAYFANTLGSATGAFCAGFVLIPMLGLQTTLVGAVALNFATAGLLVGVLPLATPARRLPLAAGLLAVAVACASVPLPWNAEALTSGAYRRPQFALDHGVRLEPYEGLREDALLFYRDGLSGTVSVNRSAGNTFLRVNGKTEAGTARDMLTQVLSAHVPLLFGAPAERVLVIGYASGITVGSAARHPLARLDAVEIEPAVLEGSRYFGQESGNPLEDPRVRVIIDDGRTYLSYTRERYDVVISEPSNPWISGVANLFTQEYFHAVRGVLEPGGRLLQWLPLYGVDEVTIRAILGAVRAEFPHVYAFSSVHGLGDLLLLATLEPLGRDDLPRWEELSIPVRADLNRIQIFSTEDLWSLVRLVPEDVDALLEGEVRINSDSNMLVELRAPRTLHADTVDVNWELMSRFPFGALPLLRRAGEPLDAERIGRLALSYASYRRDPGVASALLATAQSYGPSGAALAAELALAQTAASPEALAQLDRAVELDDGCMVRLIRAEARLGLADGAGALADADACLAREPHDTRARLVRARALWASDKLQAAAGEMDRLIVMGPGRGTPAVEQTAAEIYLARGRLQDGARVLQGVLERQPENPANWLLLADAFGQLGLGDAAARAQRNAEVAELNLVRLLHREARRLLWEGQTAPASQILNHIASAHPDYEPARRDLADLR
jgi:spermidine synthase